MVVGIVFVVVDCIVGLLLVAIGIFLVLSGVDVSYGVDGIKVVVLVLVVVLLGTGVFVVLIIVVVNILNIVAVRGFLEVVIGVLLAPLEAVVIRAVLG